jgi:hypothetical protein
MPFCTGEQYSGQGFTIPAHFYHALLLLAQSIAAEAARLIEKEVWQSPMSIKPKDSQLIAVAGRFIVKNLNCGAHKRCELRNDRLVL